MLEERLSARGRLRALVPRGQPRKSSGEEQMFQFLKRHPVLIVGSLVIFIEGVFLALAVPRPATAAPQTASTTGVLPDGRSEVFLGDFRVRNHQIPGDNYVIKFTLCLAVPPDYEPELESALKNHEQRVRESVSIVARRADANVLAESSLPTLKRRMKAAIVGAIQTDRFDDIEVLLPAFLMARG